MDLFHTDIVMLTAGLFVLNFLAVLIVRSEERFWLPGALIWISLLTALFIVRESNRREVELEGLTNTARTATEKEDPEKTGRRNVMMEQMISKNAGETNVLFTLAGWQTIFCFVWTLLGFAKTKKKFFSSALLVFLFLSILYVVIAIFL